MGRFWGSCGAAEKKHSGGKGWLFGEFGCCGCPELGTAGEGARVGTLPEAVPVPAGHADGADGGDADGGGVGGVGSAAIAHGAEILQPITEPDGAEVVKQRHPCFGAGHGAAVAQNGDGGACSGDVGGAGDVGKVRQSFYGFLYGNGYALDADLVCCFLR